LVGYASAGAAVFVGCSSYGSSNADYSGYEEAVFAVDVVFFGCVISLTTALPYKAAVPVVLFGAVAQSTAPPEELAATVPSDAPLLSLT